MHIAHAFILHLLAIAQSTNPPKYQRNTCVQGNLEYCIRAPPTIIQSPPARNTAASSHMSMHFGPHAPGWHIISSLIIIRLAIEITSLI